MTVWRLLGIGVLLAAGGCGDDGTTSDGDAPDAQDAVDVPEEDVGDAVDTPAEEVGPEVDVAEDGEAEVADDGGGTWEVAAMTARLPAPGLGGITAVAAGGVAYIFGGVSGPPPTSVVDTILRYDPAADAIETLAVRLPRPTFLAAAAWDGTHAYVFGGFAGTALTDAIVRFDPAAPAVTTMTARLPEPLARTAVAEDEHYLYVMGGSTGGFTPTGFVGTIAIYDPVGDTVRAGVGIPSPRASRIGAIRCNGGIYFFGGWGPSGKFDQVLLYRPDVEITVLPARLPEALDGGSLACDGTRIYLFGGETATAIVDDIVVFDTTDDSIATAPVTLPTPRKGHAAVWIGGSAYVFGGQTETGLTAEILRVTPP